MVVRLFVAVLMLTGLIPARVCTCPAAGSSVAPGSTSDPVPEPGCDAECGCEHHASAVQDATDGDVTAHDHAVQSTGIPAHPDRHDRDCPAVNPQPVVSGVAPTPAAGGPADPGVVAWAEPSGGDRPVASPQSRRRSVGTAVPLYLSLLSLRI